MDLQRAVETWIPKSNFSILFLGMVTCKSNADIVYVVNEDVEQRSLVPLEHSEAVGSH
jgi:hypothetical protein